MGEEITKYGVVGKNLIHSFSPSYFHKKFEENQIQHVSYEAFEVDNVETIINLFAADKSLKGLNVTIPFKEAIIPYLDEVDDLAKKIGAVNTIKREKSGLLKGYNTDVYGFGMSIKPFFASHHDRALIFGSGGASKAIKEVLINLGVTVIFVVRDTKNKNVPVNSVTYNDLGAAGLNRMKLFINTTPVGTYPNINETLPIPFDGIDENHLVYDLVYNPEETLLLKKCKMQGAKTINGLSMLQLQAEKSWEIWKTN